MTYEHPNNYPKLHNAAWPGVVGKGPDAEPPIDLDTMLDLTAEAEVDGVKFDGFDLFLFDPHVDIDADDDEIKQLADKVRAKNLVIGIGRRAGLAADRRRLGDGRRRRARKNFSTQVRKGCRIARTAARFGIRPYGVVRIDSATGPRRLGSRTREGNQKRIAETFRQACDIAEDHGEQLAAEGEICWGGMHSWQRMVQLLEMVDRPQTLGFQADMAHTLLYSLGYNAPEDAILPADFNWQPTGKTNAKLDDAFRGSHCHRPRCALDDRFPRRPERRHGLRHRLARQDRPPLPGRRPRRQARHPHARRLLAAGRSTANSTKKHPPRLLGRLHVPQRRDEEARDLEQHLGGHDGGARQARVGGMKLNVKCRNQMSNEIRISKCRIPETNRSDCTIWRSEPVNSARRLSPLPGLCPLPPFPNRSFANLSGPQPVSAQITAKPMMPDRERSFAIGLACVNASCASQSTGCEC